MATNTFDINLICEQDVKKAMRKNKVYVSGNGFKPDTTTDISIAFSEIYDIHYANLTALGYNNLKEAIDANNGIEKVILEAVKRASKDFQQKFCNIVKS